MIIRANPSSNRSAAAGGDRGRGEGLHRGRDLASTTRTRQTTREQGGGQGVEIDLASPSSVERLEVLARP